MDVMKGGAMLNDFFFSTSPNRCDEWVQAVRRRTDDPDLRICSGTWGAFVSVHGAGTQYIVRENEDYLFMLLGHPLCTVSKTTFAFGDIEEKAILAALEVHFTEGQAIDWTRYFNGIFAIIAIRKKSNDFLLATDTLSFVQIYYTSRTVAGEHEFLCGTHLDILAEVSDRRVVDKLSVAECILYLKPTFPYTLLEYVRSVPPASTFTQFHGQPTRSEYYWMPWEPERIDFSLEDAGGWVRQVVEDSLDTVCDEYRSIAILLSGGGDSRIFAGMLADKKNVEAVTFSESCSRECMLAQKIASRSNLRHVCCFRNEDYYFNLIDPCTQMCGFDNFYIHAHMLHLADKYDFNRNDVVLSGLWADLLLKGAQVPVKNVLPGCGVQKIDKHGYELLTCDAVKKGYQEEAHARRQRHNQMLKKIRPNSYKDFEEVFPYSMSDTLSCVSVNRRLFNAYDPFADFRIIDISSKVPVEWKINWKLQRAAFQDIFEKFKDIPHSSGSQCSKGSLQNAPRCLVLATKKKAQRYLSRIMHCTRNYDAWPKTAAMYKQAMARNMYSNVVGAGIFRDILEEVSYPKQLFKKATPKHMLFLLQIGRRVQAL
ncbi:hypothetical protein DQK91_14100 [Oceanidesulfovibrio marinus]|uniref:asparagine synthase (glutamine-hydrolyzing) n=2 Tax=Oceanidesulfovibrio marinus TaxID=370038 RepID=A0A6P1ZE60_9BACT|nr:hypothetical protein DQK91_14100 [Oceanidesulfovibrio marinus]